MLLIGEGLAVVSEEQLVSLIGRMAAEAKLPIPQCWLVTDAQKVAPAKARSFAGIISRSFVPETFVQSLRATVLRTARESERLRLHLREDAHAWLVTAARQTLGVLAGEEVRADPGARALITDGVCGSVALSHADLQLRVVIAASTNDALRLAARVLQMEVALDDGGADVFGELVNTIGGRVRAALDERGFALDLSVPEIDPHATLDPGDPWELSEWFVTAGGDRFFIGVRAVER